MGIGKNEYCRNNGNFDRYLFDKYVIKKAVDEINEKSNCIKNLTFNKKYDGRKVKCYSFSFDYVDPNCVGIGEFKPYQTENKLNNDINEDIKNYVWWE